MKISISKEDIKELLTLKKKVELYNAKERIRLLELKYQKSFSEIETWMEQSEEDFEVWNDYFQWKAYERLIKNLNREIVDIDHATDIKIT